MIRLGLTGSVATGKSFVAGCFNKLGVPVYDSDKAVHDLLGKNGDAVKDIEKIFPETVENNEVNRRKLAQIVFADKSNLKKIEKIIHPLVAKKRDEFVALKQKENKDFIVFEIPLLFESGAEKDCDYTIVTKTDKEIQKQRALAREGWDENKFERVNSLQMSTDEKVKRADFVIDTSGSKENVAEQINQLIENLREKDERNCS